MGLRRGRVVAGKGDEVDRAAEGQRTEIEGVRAAVRCDVIGGQRFNRLKGRACGRGQRQAVHEELHAGLPGIRRANETGTANGVLGRFAAADRLGKDAGLVLQNIANGGRPAQKVVGGICQARSSRDGGQLPRGAASCAGVTEAPDTTTVESCFTPVGAEAVFPLVAGDEAFALGCAVVVAAGVPDAADEVSAAAGFVDCPATWVPRITAAKAARGPQWRQRLCFGLKCGR